VRWVESKEIQKISARLGKDCLFALRVIDTRGQGMAVTTACCSSSRGTADLLRLWCTRRRLGLWALDREYFPLNSHIRTVQQHLDIIKVLFIHQLMRQCVVLKAILKCTLKQLRHVSVLQLHHHQSTAEQCNIQTPIRTQYMQPHHHRINHTPMYFNGLF